MKLILLAMTLVLLSGCSTYVGSMKEDPATGRVAGYEAGICVNFPDVIEKWKPELKGMKGCVDGKAEVHISPK